MTSDEDFGRGKASGQRQEAAYYSLAAELGINRDLASGFLAEETSKASSRPAVVAGRSKGAFEEAAKRLREIAAKR